MVILILSDEVEWQHLPLKLRITIRQFVVNLHSMLQGLDAREEIFTLGHTARLIGTDLEAYSPARQRRKVSNVTCCKVRFKNCT